MRPKFIAVALLASSIALPAAAGQILLAPGAVVGDTGSYNYPATGHPGLFPAGRIFDQQTGPITAEVFAQGYWINGDNGPAAAYITFDLGTAYGSLSFDLFNTSNGGANDRGTGNFSLVASNSLAADGANGFTLSGPLTTLVAGKLAVASGAGPRVAQSFTPGNGSAFRYLQFRPTSVASATPICCSLINNYGLNELRVFGDAPSAVPEPAAWLLLIAGFGLTGVALRRRQPAIA